MMLKKLKKMFYILALVFKKFSNRAVVMTIVHLKAEKQGVQFDA